VFTSYFADIPDAKPFISPRIFTRNFLSVGISRLLNPKEVERKRGFRKA
jgi:hypothetical protein